jgi:hypothetical protein
MTEIRYITTTTGTELIDTYDIPSIHAVKYNITVVTPTRNQTTVMETSSNGVEAYNVLNSFTSDNANPIDFQVSIVDYEMNVNIESTEANSLVIINKEELTTTLYGENTQSGKLIFNNEGFGMDVESSLPTITVREKIIIFGMLQ